VKILEITRTGAWVLLPLAVVWTTIHGVTITVYDIGGIQVSRPLPGLACRTSQVAAATIPP
jgi:hypothetical protein